MTSHKLKFKKTNCYTVGNLKKQFETNTTRVRPMEILKRWDTCPQMDKAVFSLGLLEYFVRLALSAEHPHDKKSTLALEH